MRFPPDMTLAGQIPSRTRPADVPVDSGISREDLAEEKNAAIPPSAPPGA
jgi:hypothetical protein